ncbi:methyl-accepting chemotaxis protein [Halobellus sp. Atlit-31R]|nr:methyl-accepting chemotaxis protein [Halobellus sp. Atlit-31R]
MLGSLVPTAIRKSIIRKFLILTIVLALLVSGVGLYADQRVSGLVEDSVESQLTMQAEQQASETEQWLETYKQSAQIVSQRGLIDDGGAAQGVIRSELVELPEDAHAVHVVDLPKEAYVASTNVSMQNRAFDQGRRTWVEGSRRADRLAFNDWTRVAVSEVYEHDGNRLIAFATPTRQMTSVVIITVDVTERSEMFETASNSSYVQIVNRDGTVRLSQQTERIGSEYAYGANASFLQRGLDGATDLSETDDGEIVAYAPVRGTEMAALVHQPRADAYAVSRAVDRSLVLITGVSLFGFALFGLTFGRSTIGSMRRLRDRAAQLADGDLDATLETNRTDEVADVYDAFSEMRSKLRDRIERSESLSRSLEATADEYGTVMDRAADGDLAVRMDADSESEAMAVVATRFNEMMDEMEATMTEIRRFSEAVDETSRTITSGAQDISGSSRRVSRATREIADGTEEQHELLEEISTEMEELSASVEEVAAQTDDLASRSESAATVGDDSRDAALDAVDTLDEMTQVAEETRDTVKALEAEVQGINQVVATIDEIADQTNILALNASIEAARAGSAGEGFAVVAEEIKSLAAETSERTEEIADSIESVTLATAEAVDNVETMQRRVVGGADTIEDAVQDIEDVVDDLHEVNTGIQAIDDTTEQQARSTQEVAELSDRVADISEETTEQANAAATSASEQSTSIDEIRRDIEGLSTRAEELTALLESFELSNGLAPDATAVEADASVGEESEADDGPGSATTESQSEPVSTADPAGADPDRGGTAAVARADGSGSDGRPGAPDGVTERSDSILD